MSTQFNLAQLLKSTVGGTRTYDFEADEPIDLDGSTATGVEGRVKFTLTNFGILASVRATATLHLACARCLEPFTTTASVEFDAEYRPTIDVQSGLPSQTIHTDSEFFITPNHVIDLTEALREHLLLVEEIVPICRDDCRGLCPTCGTNLNVEQCGCAPAGEESPFAALRSLLVEVDAES